LLNGAGSVPSRADDERGWLEFSPNASQVTIDGGHDLQFDNPEGVAKEIRRTLREAQ
jgi:pimeloyl-ACP methyl ester carboxylesterase